MMDIFSVMFHAAHVSTLSPEFLHLQCCFPKASTWRTTWSQVCLIRLTTSVTFFFSGGPMNTFNRFSLRFSDFSSISWENNGHFQEINFSLSQKIYLDCYFKYWFSSFILFYFFSNSNYIYLGPFFLHSITNSFPLNISLLLHFHLLHCFSAFLQSFLVYFNWITLSHPIIFFFTSDMVFVFFFIVLLISIQVITIIPLTL